MFPEFAYIMKVNIGIIVLYFTYKWLFSKDTFFKLRRSILLIFLAVALFYPLINIQGWMSQQADMKKVVMIYTAIVPGSIITPHTAVTNWHAILLSGIKYLYWVIAVALLIRFSIQLFCILNLARASRKEKVHGVDVRIMQKPNGPFSFFGLIFIHPDSINENELDEVLTHEYTHASQWHSLDVIIYELACAAFWFNPFIWLLKHEVRYNLEYLADEHVLKAGYDSKSYQYHLLGMTQQNHNDSIVLSNRFNILPLKSRIHMMNKRRTHHLFKAKYLIAIPLAGCLLLISNIDALARIKDKIVDNKLTRIIIPAINNTIENDAAQTGETDDNVYTAVEKLPEFPGGQVELLKFMTRNTNYPEKAIEKGIEGRVICSFVVRKDGSLTDATVIKGVDPTLDQEAMRVVSTMPKWTPGEQNGKAVSVKYTVPITFRLPKENKESQAEPKPVYGDPSKAPIFTIVEEMPQFPGGPEALFQYLSKKIKYPTDAVEHGIQGRVTCSFVVERDGTLNDIQVLRGVDPSLDAEAVRVIQSMPKWIPGRQRSVPVPVKYSVPVTFRLQ